MPSFHHRSINAKGRETSGIIEADSPRMARQLLRNQGLFPIEIKTNQEKKGRSFFSFLSTYKSSHAAQAIKSPGIKELTLFTRQFATLLAAGLPIEAAMTAVAEQTEKPSTKALILSVRSRVREGYSLANALREFPDTFSDLYCATLAAGEKSGHLDIVLARLADYTEQQYEMRQKIMHALIYPIIMICVAFGITGFLLEYVVPKMIAVYTTSGQVLPAMTKVLISVSEGVKAYGLYLLGGLFIGIMILRWQMKTRLSFRKKIHGFLLKLPLLGQAIQTVNTARFSRTFAILSSAGVPVVEAMTIASSLITNLVIQDAVTEAVRVVREGASIHLALKQTGYFSPMSIHMIASGEAGGQLENMLERAATAGENDITRLTQTLLALFEPAIILVMGGIVLFIVLAVLLPIFQLDQMAG